VVEKKHNYQIESRMCVLFMFELDDECKSFFKNLAY